MQANGKYYDGQRGKSHNVTLRITDTSLEIISLDGALQTSWPIEHVYVLEEPDPPIPAKLGLTGEAETRIFVDTGDWPEFKEHLPETAFSSFKLPVSWSSIIAYLGFSIAFIVALFFFVPRLLEYGAYAVPESWQDNLGTYALESVIDQPVCTAEKGADALNQIIDKLSAGAKKAGYDRDIDYEIHVVNQSVMPNAFAAPGGKLILFSAVINKADGPDEVAGILAHEMAHIQLRHPMRGMMRDLGLSLTMQMMFGSGGGAAEIAGTLGQLSYSRADESEADKIAQEILVHADLDPVSLVSFFEKLPEFGDDSQFGKIMGYLSTHPRNSDRIAELKKLEGAGNYKPVLNTQDWNNLKDICTKKKAFGSE